MTPNDLITRYPIIKGFSETVIQQVIDESSVKLDPLLWTEEITRNQVIGLMVAHTLAMEFQHHQDSTQQFVLTREGEDYDRKNPDNYYSATPYGLQLLELFKNQSLGII